MTMNGLTLDMYTTGADDIQAATKKYFEVADELIGQNRAKFPWIQEQQDDPKFKDIVSTADPLRASKFFYIFDKGCCMHNALHFKTQACTRLSQFSQY